MSDEVIVVSAVERLNKSTTCLTKVIIALTLVLVLLTAALVYLTYALVYYRQETSMVAR